MTPNLTPEQRQAIADLLYAGQKIEAIKQLRELSGLGLKEAKDMLDRLEADLRAEHPERFTAPAKRGCFAVLAVMVGLVGLVVFLLSR